MICSIQLTEQEYNLVREYAERHSISVEKAFKRALFEKIEDDYDLAVYEEARGKRQDKQTHRRTSERTRFVKHSIDTIQKSPECRGICCYEGLLISRHLFALSFCGFHRCSALASTLEQAL